jgi:hypothetical protein
LRRPTTHDTAFAWWRAALKARDPSGRAKGVDFHINEPHCGFYRRRLVRFGPFVPARIWLEATVDRDGELTSDEVMRCEVDGRERDPMDEWVYLCQWPITKADYEFMCSTSIWGKFRDGREPLAKPREPIDWLTAPPPVAPKVKRKRK